MKYIASTQGVTVPNYAVIKNMDDFGQILKEVSFPLFVKTEGYGDSLGIDHSSLVNSPESLRSKVSEIIKDYPVKSRP
jgi:hypothetical protein